MEVLELRERDKKKWDEYVRGSPRATVFHLAGWKDVMQNTFGHRFHYLFAREGDQIRGLLPLLHIKSRLSGHFLTSMPGGLCVDEDDNGEAAERLIERAKELVRTNEARYLVLRDSHHRWDVPELVTNEDHCTLVVKLSGDPEQVWRKIKKRARQLTNKAIRAEVEVVIGPDALDDFYPVYLRAMREMGTPTLGLRFFRNVASQVPAHFDLMIVRHDRQTLGGGCMAPFKDTVYCTWGGMLREFYDLRPNHLLYWETLKYGCENGFQWVDLGRSQRDSGTFTFKRNWGAEPRPLYQQYYLNGTSQPPPVGSSMKADAKYRLLANVWRRLPLPVTEILGPQLRKRMPFG